MNTLISQGAEALITKKDNYLIKDRIKKSYRLPEIDLKLRKSRTKKEAKLLKKAQELIPVPKIFSNSDYSISLEYLKGKKLSEHLDKLKNKFWHKTDMSFINANKDVLEMLRIVAANRAYPKNEKPDFNPEKIDINSLLEETPV